MKYTSQGIHDRHSHNRQEWRAEWDWNHLGNALETSACCLYRSRSNDFDNERPNTGTNALSGRIPSAPRGARLYGP